MYVLQRGAQKGCTQFHSKNGLGMFNSNELSLDAESSESHSGPKDDDHDTSAELAIGDDDCTAVSFSPTWQLRRRRARRSRRVKVVVIVQPFTYG